MIKNVIMLFFFIFVTVLNANENKQQTLFEIEGEKYNLSNFKVPKYNLMNSTYDKNIETIKKFVKLKLVFEHIIKPSPEFKKINLNEALIEYSKKSGHSITEIEKISIAMYLWKNLKLSTYNIDEKTAKLYYDNNPKEFMFKPSIKSYYILVDDINDFKKVINSLKYTNNIKTMIYKLASTRNLGESPDLSWRDEDGFYNTFFNRDIFGYLYSLKKGTFSKKEIYIPQVKKYIIFYVEDKKESFLRPFKLAKNEIIFKLKNQIFSNELVTKYYKIKHKKAIYNAEYIRAISKK